MSLLSQHCGIQKMTTMNDSCDVNRSSDDSSTLTDDGRFHVAIELYLISFIGIVGILGNIVSIIVLRQDKERRQTLLLLQVLAVSDALYLLSALLRYPVKYLMYDVSQYHRIQLYVYPLLKMFQTITIWMMVLVTVDRFIYVCRPLQAQDIFNQTSRRTFAVLVFVFGSLYSLPRFLDRCLITYQVCDNRTLTGVIYKPMFNNAYYYNIYRYAMHLVFLYLGPLVTLCVMNTRLIVTIRRSRQLHREMRVKGHYVGTAGAGYTSQTENNATLVLIIIILVFIVCETPELILRILIVLDQHVDSISAISPAFYRFNTMSALFMVINCSINFFIYFLFGKRFRYILKETFIYKFQTTTSLLTRETLPLRQQNIYV
ncbi:hypothetical protein LSH36_717g00003 [Paralvinella palmiformis]|uniref:G-protein coupled receptors family 1 profile domain-containing protein n=1 Tax=Paralvinella palmiformis TaxID=53620 RepID=A0AAD9MTK5_9ANNE|nr:hypothetical protein LSH36_717g00003 [Paralvinella palmiformis]